MSSADHYFTASPASPQELRTIDVRLQGHEARVVTAGGVFSGDHLDQATKILLDVVPPPPSTGNLLDLGCGWGPIALALAFAAPEASVWAVDVNERALDLTGRNAASLGLDRITAALPDQVPPEVTFDVIWSNPPIRIGKAALHELLESWLPRLTPDGTAYLVVSKNLGADSLTTWLNNALGAPTTRLSSSGGYRVLAVRKPGSSAEPTN